jgi:hypothetical protein
MIKLNYRIISMPIKFIKLNNNHFRSLKSKTAYPVIGFELHLTPSNLVANVKIGKLNSNNLEIFIVRFPLKTLQIVQ